MFAFSPCFLQQSQAIPLISVASVTSGGSSSKAIKRQVSNAPEEERGEKFEKAGEAVEIGIVSGMGRNYPSCRSSVVLCIKRLLILSKQLGIVN